MKHREVGALEKHNVRLEWDKLDSDTKTKLNRLWVKVPLLQKEMIEKIYTKEVWLKETYGF